MCMDTSGAEKAASASGVEYGLVKINFAQLA